MQTKTRKNVLSMLLAVMMVFTMLPGLMPAAYAQESGEAPQMVEFLNETMQDVPVGSLPNGFRHISGTVDGVVEVDNFGDSRDGKWLKFGDLGLEFSRVQYDMPAGVGDYVIEADMMMDVSTNSSRWASIMYRVQSDANSSYYQMAVRKVSTASNGVEFAHRTPAGAWDVRVAAGEATKTFENNAVRRLRVEVIGDTVREYLDGVLIIESNRAAEYLTGHIGFQCNYMETYVRNVVVSIPAPPVDENVIIHETMQDLPLGSLPEGFRRISGTVPGVVEFNTFGDGRDGKWLKVGETALYWNRIQYDMPAGAGDYTIEVDLMMGPSTDLSRWASIMYRIQGDTHPYYQFAVRKQLTATTGLEFSYMTPTGEWDVRVVKGHYDTFGEYKIHKLKVEVVGNNVKEYLDGELVIETDKATDFSVGHIGLQSNNMESYFRNLVVTLIDTPSDDIKSLEVNYSLDYPLVLGQYSEIGSVLPLSMIPFKTTTYSDKVEYFPGDDARLTYASSNPAVVNIAGGMIMAGSPGLATVTASIGEVSLSIPVWVKDASGLLINENFEDTSSLQANGLPAGWRHISGSLGGVVNVDGNHMLKLGSVNDGFSRIQYDLPEGVGNYVIKADFRFGPSTNTGRWASVMFRTQSDANNSYYQMAVRKDSEASNGVEFAEMLPNGAWAAPQPVTTSYSPAFGEDITHTLRVEVSGNKVKEYIDGKLIIFTDLATRYPDGHIGFQTANMELFIDNIKVSLDTLDLGPMPGESYASAKTLNANIVGCPTVITRIDGMNDLANVMNDRVTTSIMVPYSNKENAAAILEATAGRVLPIFIVNNITDAVELANLVASGYTDTHIASSDPDIIKAYRDIAKRSRASLIVDKEITRDDVRDIVSTVHSCWAQGVIVSAGKTDKKTIEDIQKRLTSVWMVSDDTTVGNHEAITSGVTGIISSNPAKLESDASAYTAKTLTRRPFMIAHRGLSSVAPENTLISYKMAYEAGADMFEIDINLSKDGKVYLLHDTTFARTTDILSPTCRLTDAEVAATGKTRTNIGVADLTMDQIKKLDAGSWFGAQFAGEPVPLLSELLDYMRGKDVVLFCELKDPNMAMLEPTMKVIRDMGMENQVIFISFNNSQTVYMTANHPDMPCGNLNNVSTDLGNPLKTVSNILNTILPMNSTYNPSSGGLNQAIIAECIARGLTLWPWTINSGAEVRNFIDWGATGVTTDYSQNTSDAVMGIFPERRSYVSGEAVTVNYTTLTNKGIETNLKAEFIVIEGAENIVSMDGNTIRVAPGTSAVVMLKAQSPAVTNCLSYTLYSQPITVSGVKKDVVKASVSAFVYDVDGAKTLVIAVNEFLSDGTVNTIYGAFPASGDIKGTYSVGGYQVKVTVSDGKVVCSIEEEEPAVTLIKAEPSASVQKNSGNTNTLTVTVTETFSDGKTNKFTGTFTINNNAAGTYTVGSYKVYVDTKGNDQIRECYIVK